MCRFGRFRYRYFSVKKHYRPALSLRLSFFSINSYRLLHEHVHLIDLIQVVNLIYKFNLQLEFESWILLSNLKILQNKSNWHTISNYFTRERDDDHDHDNDNDNNNNNNNNNINEWDEIKSLMDPSSNCILIVQVFILRLKRSW